MLMRSWIRRSVCGLFATMPLLASASAATNLALHRSYEWSTAPTYALTTGDSDATDLTDGFRGTGRLWTSQSTVGWYRSHKPVTVTVDLGAPQAIEGAAIHLSAGTAGVHWPRAIVLLTSEDGEVFWPLAELRAAADAPAYGSARSHLFSVRGLKAHGRFVRFGLVAEKENGFLFADEIEVYGPGDAAPPRTAPQTPRASEALFELIRMDREGAGNIQSSFDTYIAPLPSREPLRDPGVLTQRGIRQRWILDLVELQRHLDQATLDGTTRASFQTQLDALRQGADELPSAVDPLTFRPMLPIDARHEAIYRLHGQLRAAEGRSSLTLWQNHRHAALHPFDQPQGTDTVLKIQALTGEHRPATFNLTNASDQPRTLTLRVAEVPEAAGTLEVFQAEFIDHDGRTLCDPLLPAPRTEAGYHISIPAGMTRQVWLAFAAGEQGAGHHQGRIHLQDDAFAAEIPLHWSIAPARATVAPLQFQMWDYAASPGDQRGFTQGNRAASINDMQAHGVNLPWAHRTSAPWPKTADFDAQGNFIGTLDLRHFDAFLEAWPNAARYMIFLGIRPGRTLADIGPDDARFERALGQWIRAWGDALQERGLEPGRVTLLLVDEPRNAEDWLATLQWSRVIKAATEMFHLFVNPNGPHPPALEHSAEALAHAEILSPLRGAYEQASAEEQAFYQDWARQPGKELFLYHCSGPVQSFNATYYLLQPWRCFEIGASGSGYWTYGADAPTSWNMFISLSGRSFTPIYMDATSVTGSKRWEAAREGVQDYALFHTLDEAVGPGEARRHVQAVLERMQQTFGHDPHLLPEAAEALVWADLARQAIFERLLP